MYNSFFAFRENPFNLTPDPRFLYLSPYHKEALDNLLSGIRERKGLITITGVIGTGKTTLCRTVLHRLDESTKSALIFNSFVSDIELLKIIHQEFGIDGGTGAESKKTNMNVLIQFLMRNACQGGNAVLLIDEAQNLSYSVLQQILTLSRLQKGKEKLIQIVLVGQPELKNNLTPSLFKNFHEDTTLRLELKPLDPKDIRGYVEHRLEVADGRANVRFTNGVFNKIYASSQGNPRRINAICDRALLIAYVKEKHTISKRMVGKAVEDLQGDITTGPSVMDWSWIRFKPANLFLLILIMAGAFLGWSLREQIFGIFSAHKKPADVRIVKPVDTVASAVKSKEEPILSSHLQGQDTLQKKSSELEKPQSLAGMPTSATEKSAFEKAPKMAGSTIHKKSAFSVQVGAFRVRANAKRLAAELVWKGYTPNIVEISDYRKNPWYSVRIREHTDLEDAYQVATEFKEEEGKPAIVTGADSLDPVPAQSKQS